jgi:hypothetical protein
MKIQISSSCCYFMATNHCFCWAVIIGTQLEDSWSHMFGLEGFSPYLTLTNPIKLLTLTGLEIWQKHHGTGTTNKDGDSGFVGCVAVVVEGIDRLFPDWFSLLHVFPTFYWPLSWAKYYFSLQRTHYLFICTHQ